MGANGLLSKAASTIRAGGRETLQNPPVFFCSDQTHEPFRVLGKPVQFYDRGDQPFLWGVVRTSGMQFFGDRTDIHDVFSLIWGAVLRAFGLSSVWLIDEPHGFAPGEIGARHLLFCQCPWNVSRNAFETARKSMNAWSAFAFHLLDDVFKWGRSTRFDRPDSDTVHRIGQCDWADRITKYLRFPKDITIIKRKFPLWLYFASHKRGVTVIRMPRIRLALLKVVLKPFAPETTEGDNALAMFANGIANAVPYKLVKKAHKLLSLTNDTCDNLMILPLDSHCLFIGDRTLVALRGECGREIFERERDILIKRRENENRVFFTDSVIEWQRPISAGDFEDLCLDLVRREPGVVRAKPVGSVNDRDGGRDIIIDQMVPTRHPSFTSTASVPNEGEIVSGGTKTVRLIAQVKTRLKTIGKRDVQDIRDTLERHQAKGFLLIAHPRISTALVDHLEDLRQRTELRTEWWETHDIEDRLRRHPDIAKRYPRLVALRLAKDS